MMTNLIARLYKLNPRWLYLALTVAILIPMVFDIPNAGLKVSRGPAGVYKITGECPQDKVILIESSWDMGSKPEAMPQLECYVRDLCKRKVKFVVFSAGMYAPTFAMEVIQPIVKDAGYVYGKDWVNLGFIQPPAGNMGVLIESMFRDMHSTRPVDINGTDVKEIPLMQSVKSSKDIHMVFTTNYCPPLEWMSFGKAQYGVPVAFGSAAIMGPYYYNFVDSGQLCGLMAGIRGSQEYEYLAGIRGSGSRTMMSFAFGLCFMIVGAILGNIGYLAALRLRRTR